MQFYIFAKTYSKLKYCLIIFIHIKMDNFQYKQGDNYYENSG
jgi:hypothetical protein